MNANIFEEKIELRACIREARSEMREVGLEARGKKQDARLDLS